MRASSPEKKREDARERGKRFNRRLCCLGPTLKWVPPLILTVVALKGLVVPGLFLLREMS